MLKSLSHQPDSILIYSLSILVLVGLLMLFTSSIVLSKEKTRSEINPNGTATYYLFHQILYGLIPGLILAYICSRISLNFFKTISPLLLLSSIFLLALVFVSRFGFSAGGATRWIKIGFITFQPSEFAKLSLCFYLAAFLAKKIKEKKIRSFKGTIVPLIIILIPFITSLLVQPDMGTLGILSIISLLMLFGAGGSISHILFLVSLGIVILFLSAFYFFPYQAERILTFLNPQEDVLERGYQITQSLIALGSGGIFGRGLGNGIQKYNYLPQPMNDTIFAVWGEETGFIGSVIVIILFLMICWRGFIIAKRAPNVFSQLLGIGITSWIGMQAFLNIMAVSGLIPFSGMPLPFISYGSSALICNLIGAGVLINISRRAI